MLTVTLAPPARPGTLTTGADAGSAPNATVKGPAGTGLLFWITALTVIGSAVVGASGVWVTLWTVRSAAESTAMKGLNEDTEPPMPSCVAYRGDGRINRAANAPSRCSRLPTTPAGGGGSTALVHTSPSGSAARAVNSIALGLFGSGCASTSLGYAAAWEADSSRHTTTVTGTVT